MPSKKTGAVPAVLDSERALLGLAIRGNQDHCLTISQELSKDDFYGQESRQVYEALVSLLDEDLAINPISVSERAGLTQSDLEPLFELASKVSSKEVSTLISDIQRVSGLRKAYYACQDGLINISRDSKLEDVLGLLEKAITTGDRTLVHEARDGSEILNGVVEDFLRRHAEGGGCEISTGLKELDRAIIGLRPCKNVVVAGRPGMGKTALADSIRRAVVSQGFGAISFSLEMGAEELAERELAFQASTNLRKILSAKDVTPGELERVKSAVGCLLSGRWAIDDSTYNIQGIRRRARVIAKRMARAGIKVGVIILDYIQLAGDNGEHREQSVSAISRGCKLMAKEIGCTVLALSQLNRQCEQREDKRPLMSDLRESGSIEQDADIVGFVYREHQYDNSYPPEEAEFIIRKHRSGPCGTVHLRYNPKLVAFGDTKTEVKNEAANLSEEVRSSGLPEKPAERSRGPD